MNRLKKSIICIGAVTGILLVLILLLVTLSIFTLKTDYGQRFIQESINRRIPGTLHWGSLQFSLLWGDIEIRECTVAGPDGKEIIGFDRLSIGVLWNTLPRHTLTIGTITLQNPRIDLRVAGDGRLNLLDAFIPGEETGKAPPDRPAGDAGRGIPFNIIVKELVIREGSFSYGMESPGITTALEQVNLTAAMNLLEESASLTLGTGKGHIEAPSVKTDIDHLHCDVEVREGLGTVRAFQGAIATGTFDLRGEMDFRTAFPEGFFHSLPDPDSLVYRISFAEKDIRIEKLLEDAPVRGIVTASLVLEGRGVSPQRLSARLDGNITAQGIVAGDGYQPLDAHISLKTALKEGAATLEQLKGSAGGIAITARGRTDYPSQEVSAELTLKAPDLSGTLASFGVKDVAGEASVTARLGGTLQKPLLECTIEGNRLLFGGFRLDDLMIDASLDDSGILNIDECALRSAHSELRAAGTSHLLDKGTFNRNPSFQFDIESDAIRLEDFTDRAQGTVSLRGRCAGSLEEPLLDLATRGANLRFGDFLIGDARTQASLDKEGTLRIDELILRNGKSTLTASASARILDKTRFLKDPPFQLDFESPALFLEDFTELARGTLSLSGHCEGTVTEPRGTVNLRASRLDPGVQRIEELTLRGRLEDKRFFIEPLQVFPAPGETLEGRGWISLDGTYNFNLVSTGISLRSIDLLSDQQVVEGIVALHAAGEGTLANPRLAGTFTLRNLLLEGKKFDDFKIDLELHDWLARATGRLNFDVEGSYHLKEKDFVASLIFRETDLVPYFKIAGRPELTGSATGTLKVKGNAGVLRGIEASADFPELTLLFSGNRLLASQNFRATYGRETVVIAPTRFELLQEGYLEIEGRGTPGGAVDLLMTGALPLQVLTPFLEDLPDLAGKVTLTAEVKGTRESPDLQGVVELHDVGFTVPGLLQKLHRVRGRVEITPRTVAIQSLQGSLDSGRFEMAGTVDMEKLKPVRMNVSLSSTALPIRIPDTLDLQVNTDLTIAGTPDKSSIRGDLTLLEGTYYRDVNLSLLQLVTERKRKEAPTPPAEIAHPFLENMSLDITVKRRNPFVIDNNLARLDVSPDLRIRGTLTTPLIVGRAQVDEGTITYRKRTFTVQKGVIDFLNPYRIEPTIDIAGDTRIRKWLISLTISGTPDQLRFTFASDPPEEDSDILSLLLVGKTAHELADKKGGTGQSTKEMVAEMLASTFGEDIKTTTGLDIFEVETGTQEEETASEHIKVTLGKELSRRMTVKYSAETKDGEMIQRAIAEYKFLEHVLLSGFQDSQGVFGGEMFFRLEFR